MAPMKDHWGWATGCKAQHGVGGRPCQLNIVSRPSTVDLQPGKNCAKWQTVKKKINWGFGKWTLIKMLIKQCINPIFKYLHTLRKFITTHSKLTHHEQTHLLGHLHDDQWKEKWKKMEIKQKTSKYYVSWRLFLQFMKSVFHSKKKADKITDSPYVK